MKYLIIALIVYLIFKIAKKKIVSILMQAALNRAGSAASKQQQRPQAQKNEAGKKYNINEKDIVDAQFEEIREKDNEK